MTVKGFTLIELLVVISIMGILAIVSFVNLGPLREDQGLKAAANELQSLIRVAQTNAGSSVKCTPTTSGTSWSLDFSPTSVVLDCPGGSPKTLTLTNNVRICAINYSNCSIASDTCSTTNDSFAGIVIPSTSFAPLTSQATFTDLRCSAGSLQSSSTMTITLKKVGGSTLKSVIFSKGGTVETR